MAWRRRGDKPLSEPILVILPTPICVTRPHRVKSKNGWSHLDTALAIRVNSCERNLTSLFSGSLPDLIISTLTPNLPWDIARYQRPFCMMSSDQQQCGTTSTLTKTCLIFSRHCFCWWPSNVTEHRRRTHDAIMSLLRQNDVVTSFWRNNHVIILSCARWAGTMTTKFGSDGNGNRMHYSDVTWAPRHLNSPAAQ